MKNAYTFGRLSTVELKHYDLCKYNPESECYITSVIDNVDWFAVVSGAEAKALEDKEGIYEEYIDDFHEYLIVHQVDGAEHYFRNSRVDLFRY